MFERLVSIAPAMSRMDAPLYPLVRKSSLAATSSRSHVRASARTARPLPHPGRGGGAPPPQPFGVEGLHVREGVEVHRVAGRGRLDLEQRRTTGADELAQRPPADLRVHERRGGLGGP